MHHASDWLDLAHQPAVAGIQPDEAPWAVLSRLSSLMWDPAVIGTVDPRACLGACVHIGAGTIVEPGAVIKGPAWIGENCVIRSGAYLRENVVVGNDAVLGNSSEFKNCVIFDRAEIPHFNYVGDSVVGHRGHLAAGVILSNVRLDRGEVTIRLNDGSRIATGLKKFGAIIGDEAEIGCNSVISPGSLIGRGALIYPCTHWNGVLESRHMVQNTQSLRVRPRKTD